ncbi:MAG: MATE family efflux transporter [Erysipelotrichaceae bacterium]|nr:MATE family efflux transporter [Erysipelotrichaceae bacterium]
MTERKKTGTRMTEGKITPLIIRFAIPLLLGNIFQQFYNMVDSWVVGNFVSNEAFSAVGTVGPIINMLIGFFMGLSSGAGVVISQYYGASKEDQVSDTVHTAIMMTIALSVIITALGLVLMPVMLGIMNTPESVLPEARSYLTIYFSGVAGLLFYNIGASILQATGDSKRPFYFLATAAVTNVVLDLLFVIVFHMGVEGVAYATVIAQLASAALVMFTLFRTDSCVKIIPSKLKMHWDVLARIIRVGIPAALQMAIISFSNIFVQSYINHFGADCMSGWTAYSKIDALMLLPMQSIGLATTTFVGQNIGVGKVERVREGVRTGLMLSVAATVIPMIPVMLFAPQLVAFFNSKKEVVDYGVLMIRWISPFYALTCSSNIQSAALRGSGDTKAPMIIMIFSFVIFRQIYLFIVANFISNTVIPIFMGYPAGWLVCTVLTAVYYHKADLARARV